MTPFQDLYGRLPPNIPPYVRGSSKNQAIEDILLERDELLKYLKTNLLQAQNRMKQKSDSKRREMEFQVGDQVLVRLQPYRQISISRKSTPKLAPCF